MVMISTYTPDTDSIHSLLTEEELRNFCDIDDFRLGAWACEGKFSKAKFIRQKCYIENIYTKLNFKKLKKHFHFIKKYKLIHKKLKYCEIKITCAGLPKNCYNFVTWENFKTGFTCGGKLTYTHVKGGIILKETEFTIKEEKLKKNIEEFKL